MKKILILGLLLLCPQLALAQTSRNPCFTTGLLSTQGILNCVSVGAYTSTGAYGPLPVGGLATAASPTFVEGRVGGLSFDLSGNLRTTGGGGGGGGLSVIDQTAFTQGTSAFTPSGGVFNDTATLSSGQEGTYRLTTKRAQIVDTDTTGNALYAAITAPVPAGTNIIGKVGIDQTTPGTTNGVQVNAALPAGANTVGTVGQLPYPVGAVPLTASATGTTAATTATLAGTSGKTTYICGYSIRANATATVTVTNTLTGVISGTMSSIMWVPANTAGLGVDEQIFQPCIPASAANTAIAVVSGAPGTGGVVSSKAWGYQL